ncbi:hypothetical protein [Thalassotalea euphylliae]|uniref:Uncharacterized protein n=1 Tax=Thalassotalea euphylliae TaxID=1655234 RepID=A0A3E0U262_9GAMM|nr:hypothetical protein [Thalassotalea euphylliae]REL30819.1 hypothetical protein DXX94_08865 [Thalassotalea euphylliae]
MKTVRVICSIQEGSLGYNNIKQLEAVISSTYKAHFGADYRLVFAWLDLPYRQSYIAGKLSCASTVQLPVEDGMPADKRHPFMSEICAKWQHITGCSKNEIILVSPDMSEYERMHEAFDARVDEKVRKKTKLRMMLRLIVGYFKKGYLTTSTDL